MSDFDRNIAAARTGYRTDQVAIDAGLRAYMIRVYNYMASGVALTGLVAWFAYQAAGGSAIAISGHSITGLTGFGQAIFGGPLMWVFILAPLGLVMLLSFGINRLSASTALALFFVYAGLLGLALAAIFLEYTGASITRVFFISAATFGAMSSRIRLITRSPSLNSVPKCSLNVFKILLNRSSSGSGFLLPKFAVSSITFGGVAATKWTALSASELQVTVPAETKATACTTGKGFHPANTCQVQVVVTNNKGKSPSSKILAPYVGSLVANNEGIVVPTAGTEIDPAPSEYDYAPRPKITSVGPQPYSESGSGPIVIKGTGFNVLTLDWVNVGLGSLAADNYSTFSTLTDTRITLFATLPALDAGTRYLRGGISALGLGGRSNAVRFRYKP